MNEKLILKIERLEHNKTIPSYATDGSAGMDLSAAIDKSISLKPMERKLIPTGIKIELPKNHEAQIRPRSGLSIKHGITLVNCVGTIDEDYRGEVKIPVINLSNRSFTIKPQDRIAQMVIVPVTKAQIYVVENLNETSRGSGGFGSTGINHSNK